MRINHPAAYERADAAIAVCEWKYLWRFDKESLNQ
jgi:hypothetical protein